MKINNKPKIQRAMGLYKKNLKNMDEIGKSKRRDKVDISDNARLFQTALSEYKKLPDVRNEKIEEIKTQMNAGKYNPSAKEIANHILNKRM